MITNARKQQLEAQGCIITQGFKNHRQQTFITHPDGKTLSYFPHLSEIKPGDLYDGEEFDLDERALPIDYRYIGIAVDNYEYLPESGLPAEPTYDPETGQLILPWWAICMIIYAIAASIIGILTMVCALYQKFKAPCGINGSERIVNDCWKIIILPDCSKRPFNSCSGPDDNGDGYPDGEWDPNTPWIPPPGITDEIVTLIIVAVVAIGGIFVLQSFLKEKPSRK